MPWDHFLIMYSCKKKSAQDKFLVQSRSPLMYHAKGLSPCLRNMTSLLTEISDEDSCIQLLNDEQYLTLLFVFLFP